MGFLDKIKGAVNAVTGGAATVTIQYAENAQAGKSVPVKVTAVSKGGEVKSKGIFVDFIGEEEVTISKRDESKFSDDYHREFEHSKQEFQLCDAFVLAPNETKVIEGTIQLPSNLQPSFEGRYTKNKYAVRGRLEAKGNDPDSGFKPIRIVVVG